MTAEWFSASELADLELPGLPKTPRRVRSRAKAEGWSSRRQQESTGGRRGHEYHISSLPDRARAALLLKLKRSETSPTSSASPEPENAEAIQARSEELWDHFERLPGSVQDEADRRFDAVQAVEAMVQQGSGKMAAYRAVAGELGVSVPTIRGWLRLIEDAPRGDRLPMLAPQYTGRTTTAEYDPTIYQRFRDLYLDMSRPSYSICYRRIQAIAEKEGLEMPSERTLVRRFKATEDPFVVTLAREGEKAAEAMYPSQRRDRSHFHAMEALNMDGHTLDIAVEWPDGEICRANLITVQDLYSGMVSGWRLAKSESAYQVGLAALNAFESWGLPRLLYADNTLAMAAKVNTGGIGGRKRFKDKPGDPDGAFKRLGIEFHWTRTAHGQSKPIERAFRDLAERISKHPEFSGAYLGNNPVNKPGNYGTKVVPVAKVAEIAEKEILRHNQQPGRRTDVCAGNLSFWQAFQRSYQSNTDRIRRLSEGQKRLLYLRTKPLTVQGRGYSGVTLFGNHYWAEPLARFAGRKVIVRYHPDNLHGDVFVYTQSGKFICEAACQVRAGFDSQKAADEHERARQQVLRSKKKLAKAERHLSAKEIAAMEPDPPQIIPALAVGDGVTRGSFGVDTDPRQKIPTIQPPSRAEEDQAQRRVSESLAPLQGQFRRMIEERTQE